MASEMVHFTSDQFTIRAFQVEPPRAIAGSPAVLVIHEWWGLNDHIKDIARRFADEGYVAFAPDLYSRLGSKVTKDPNEAAGLMNALSSQATLRDLNAATGYLRRQPCVDPLRIGIVGFCMGGTIALTQACHNSDLKAAVVFYGKVPPLETFDYLLCPVLYHYGAKDGWVTKQEVERLQQGLRQFGKPGAVHIYPEANHAFFNDTRPDVYRAPDAKAAWQKTLAFLKAHLG
ncbi:MAG: dienelactone hydrolase family protein [Candidatus Omnitrophica bacterium]|nr:dienelactone hydrolase family protein [Candidatus Omnitrophota bacterium]MBI2496005.1 dienelactone hydrolase family protein [Candidatus Omnitrophota bacterium]MBI3020462.1 dienelactone hydrolase family protein [Candidatus Omnitrophota bacterium]